MKKQEVSNYGRFFSAFNRLRLHGEPAEARRLMVLQYTGGRTESLKEMSRKEYTELCSAIEEMNGSRDELRRRRSIVLKLMQELNVDTTDWAQVNDFCRHPRISGKAFGQLTIDELIELAVRLRSIKKKEWQRKDYAKEETKSEAGQRIVYLINLAGYSGASLN